MSPLEHVAIDDRESTAGVRRARGVIGDEWGIVFAHGGVVTATMLHAAGLALAREDLELRSAAATFCRPVPCGAVAMEVSVLRGGRTGAQVHVSLRADGEDGPSPNAVATAVYASEADDWPEQYGVCLPPELTHLPGPHDTRLGVDDVGGDVANFFTHTDWRLTATQPEEPLRRTAWFSFTEPPLLPDGAWEPSMLAVPSDALGLAVVPAVSAIKGPLTAPSLQLSFQLAGPARGDWLGIDSRAFHTQGSIASGVATLWNTDGTFVGSATQTALLRRL